jgi:hypothetical protein
MLLIMLIIWKEVVRELFSYNFMKQTLKKFVHIICHQCPKFRTVTLLDDVIVTRDPKNVYRIVVVGNFLENVHLENQEGSRE